MTFGPDGAFGMDIHVLEAWTQNSHGAKSHGGLILEARIFHSGSNILGLDIWPRWSIWDSHGAKSHGGLILEVRFFS